MGGRRRLEPGRHGSVTRDACSQRLGITPVVFPGGHAGFLGGEYGQTGKPDEFAARLRDVLAEP